MKSSCYTCASNDLQELQRYATTRHTSLQSRKRYCSLAEMRRRREEYSKQKAIQNLCFDLPGEHHQVGASSPLRSGRTSLYTLQEAKDPLLVHEGNTCVSYHAGARCFPSHAYGVALVQLNHGENTAAGKADDTLLLKGSASAKDIKVAEPELLWSIIPPHLLISLIRTPHDAECVLARLREEEQQLRCHV